MRTHKTLSWLIALVGFWELSAAFVLGYAGTAAALWNAVVIGLALIVLGIWAAMSETQVVDTSLDWANIVLGIWLVIAPFLLGYSAVTAALWNDVLAGVIVVAFAAWAAFSLGHPHVATPKTA